MAKMKWNTELDGDSQKLVTLWDNEDSFNPDYKSVAEYIEHWSVAQVRDTLTQFDAELLRLEEMKSAIIDTKKQVKNAILKGIKQ